MVDLVGRACATIAWLFSTRNRPAILKINPQDKEKVSIDSKITVEFSEPVDVENVNNNFIVKVNGTKINGKIDVSGRITNIHSF